MTNYSAPDEKMEKILSLAKRRAALSFFILNGGASLAF